MIRLVCYSLIKHFLRWYLNKLDCNNKETLLIKFASHTEYVGPLQSQNRLRLWRSLLALIFTPQPLWTKRKPCLFSVLANSAADLLFFGNSSSASYLTPIFSFLKKLLSTSQNFHQLSLGWIQKISTTLTLLCCSPIVFWRLQGLPFVRMRDQIGVFGYSYRANKLKNQTNILNSPVLRPFCRWLP